MVLEQIIKMVAEQFMIDENEITADTSFVDDLGADSLDVVELTMALEETFSLPDTPEDELTNIEAHLAPECIAPMIRQGMADGSIHTADANALAEALFVLADIWLSPQTRPTTPAQQRARNLVFQQMTHALGLDLLTDAQAEQLVQLCTPVKG